METADAELTSRAMQQQAPDNTFAVFFKKARENKAKTAEEGRPIFDEVPYIRIMIPGDKDNIVERPVRENDKSRYHAQWAAFEANDEQFVSGTPLEAWPLVNRGQVEELKFFGITTVEQLADLSDSHAGKWAGVVTLKQKAKSFLAAAEGVQDTTRLERALEVRDNEISALRGQIVDLASEIKQLLSKRSISAEEKETTIQRLAILDGSGEQMDEEVER